MLDNIYLCVGHIYWHIWLLMIPCFIYCIKLIKFYIIHVAEFCFPCWNTWYYNILPSLLHYPVTAMATSNDTCHQLCSLKLHLNIQHLKLDLLCYVPYIIDYSAVFISIDIDTFIFHNPPHVICINHICEILNNIDTSFL